MLESKEKSKPTPKTCWVTYKLQGLSTEKFLKIVEKIIEGEYTLIKPPAIEPEELEEFEEFEAADSDFINYN